MFRPSLPQLYSSLQQFIEQTLPDRCRTRVANLLWMMSGIFLSRSVQLNHLAGKVPIRAKKLSTVKRFSRFLDNPAVQARIWYEPFARWLLHSAGSSGQVHLIIDATKVAFGYRLVMLSVAYRRRSLPLAWTWVSGVKGHSTSQTQVALLKAVKAWFPDACRVSLVGDCEFRRGGLIAFLRQVGWDYALRQVGSQQVWWQGNGRWQRIDSLLDEPGCRWLGWVVLTHTHEQLTHFVAFWRKGQTQAWWLATNQGSLRAAVRLYRRRMWIEEMFADFKRHGFDLEASHLRAAQRLERLTLLVCLLYLWLIAVARRVELAHLVDLVDRHDRRDLSLFRLGWDFVERCLSLHDPIPIILPSHLLLVSGS
jgi:Transposase DDE domain